MSSIIIIILTAIEVIATVIFAISGSVVCHNYGGYPNETRFICMIRSLMHPESAHLIEGPFIYMAQALMGISILMLFIKIIIAQIKLLRENKTRAVLTFICSGLSFVAMVVYLIVSSRCSQKVVDITSVSVFLPIVVMFFIMKGTRPGRIIKYHFAQMGVEFLVVPFIMWLTGYTISEIAGGIVTGVVLLGVACAVLAGGSSPAYSGAPSESSKRIGKIDERIAYLHRNTRDNEEGLRAKAEGRILRGHHVDVKVTNDNIRRNNREIEQLLRERSKLDRR